MNEEETMMARWLLIFCLSVALACGRSNGSNPVSLCDLESVAHVDCYRTSLNGDFCNSDCPGYSGVNTECRDACMSGNLGDSGTWTCPCDGSPCYIVGSGWTMWCPRR